MKTSKNKATRIRKRPSINFRRRWAYPEMFLNFQARRARGELEPSFQKQHGARLCARIAKECDEVLSWIDSVRTRGKKVISDQ